MFGVETVVTQGILAMSLVAGFLSPVTVGGTQFVTVVVKADGLAMGGLLGVSLEEERG
jgi:hypothetical protein